MPRVEQSFISLNIGVWWSRLWAVRFVVWPWHLFGKVSREKRFSPAGTQRAKVDYI